MTLQIKIINATLSHQFNKFNSYIKAVDTHGKIFVTKKSTGCFPKWNQTIECSIHQKTIEFYLFGNQQKLKKDQIVCQGVLNFTHESYVPYSKVMEQIKLKKNAQKIGTLQLEIVYQEGLRFIGTDRKKSLDLSSIKLLDNPEKGKIDINTSRSRLQNSNKFEEKKTQAPNSISRPTSADRGSKPFSAGSDSSSAMKRTFEKIGAFSNTIKKNQSQNHPTFSDFNTSIFVTPEKKQKSVQIIRISANKRNLFSWLDSIGKQIPFQLAPQRLLKSVMLKN